MSKPSIEARSRMGATRQRNIRILRPRFEHTYEEHARRLGPPHGPDDPCLACADARADVDHPPLVTEWEHRARMAREAWELDDLEDEPPLESLGMLFVAVALAVGTACVWYAGLWFAAWWWS